MAPSFVVVPRPLKSASSIVAPRSTTRVFGQVSAVSTAAVKSTLRTMATLGPSAESFVEVILMVSPLTRGYSTPVSTVRTVLAPASKVTAVAIDVAIDPFMNCQSKKWSTVESIEAKEEAN